MGTLLNVLVGVVSQGSYGNTVKCSSGCRKGVMGTLLNVLVSVARELWEHC